MTVRSLDNGVLSDRHSAGRAGRFLFWSGVAHGGSRATKTEGRLHPDHRLRAGRAGRGAGRVRAAGPRGRDPPRGVVGQRARQAGAGRARRLAHPGAAAAGDHARHRQRQRAAGQRHDAAGERQRAHPLATACGGDRGGRARTSPAATPLDARAHRRRRAQARRRRPAAARARLGVSLLGAELHGAALAVVGRARSRSRRPPHRRAAAAYRGASVGRRDRRLLRRRAVEPAVAGARHRPHRAHRARHLEGHAGEGAGHHRGLGGKQSRRR